MFQNKTIMMNYLVSPILKPIFFLIDLVGSLLFFCTKLFSWPKFPKKILVIRLDHAGDMLMSTPVFRALKNKFPSAQLFVLCRPFAKSIIETNKNVDEVLTLEVPWFKRKDAVSWFQTIKFLLNLRKEKFDFVFELHADPRNIAAAFLIGGFRVGYAVRGFGFLLNRIVYYSLDSKHTIERNLDVVRSIGADSSSKLDIFISSKDTQKINYLLKKNYVSKYFLIHPFAGRPEKLWDCSKWAELCTELIKKYGVKIIVSGSDSDSKACEIFRNLVQKEFKSNILNFCGLLDNFRMLGALISKSKVLISTDTVALHLAHALGNRFVALYGPTDPAVWGYGSKKEISLYVENSDSCGINCRVEKHRMTMLDSISVSDVLSAIKRLLGQI